MRSKARTVPVDIEGVGTFLVWYRICPAEPDVGIMQDYIELEVTECPAGVKLNEDMEDRIRTNLYWELDL